jgi:hypothetical protein
VEGKPLWIFLLPLAGIIAVASALPYCLADRVRIAGYLLTLAGIALVAIGIGDTRKLFGRPSTMSGIKRWWRSGLSLIFPGPDQVARPAAAARGGSTVGGSLTTASVRGPRSSLAQRVAVLEEDHRLLRERLDKAKQEVLAEVESVQESVDDERRARTEADQKISHQLTEFSVGGLHLEAVGVVWLIIGETCSSLPEGVAARLVSLGTLSATLGDWIAAL